MYLCFIKLIVVFKKQITSHYYAVKYNIILANHGTKNEMYFTLTLGKRQIKNH